MSIPSIIFPETLSGDQLDQFLALGWFRMGQSIFTINSYMFGSSWHSVYWIRLNVRNARFGKSARKIWNLNKDFSFTVDPYQPSEETEALYSLYKSSVDFDGPQTVGSFLEEDKAALVYNTRIIRVRLGEQLIAAGVFDLGENSIAGIMNFYHPDFKKYSLGKYLMLLKLNYAGRLGMHYYYPGYIARGYPKFDYKLFIDPSATEVYDWDESGWIPLHDFLRKHPLHEYNGD
ncbi:MAG TPA: GNAT family N-acetyltransferase [Chitinophagaceae bacterium]|nr:GNAT family N-acetyltransferase [Chitinophagaceae bacterium]